MEDLYSENQQDSILGDNQSLAQKALRLLSSPTYELFMNILTTINICAVLIRSVLETQSEIYIHTWCITQISINIIMGIEMVSDMIVSGPFKAYTYHFRIWPETLCQILNVPAMIWYFKAYDDYERLNKTVKIFEVIVFIRMIKFLTLMYEVKVMRVIFETMKNLLGPINNLALVMLTIFYVFAQLGMVAFGGLIKKDSQ